LPSSDFSENPGAIFPVLMRISSCVPIQRESRRKIPINKFYSRKVKAHKIELSAQERSSAIFNTSGQTSGAVWDRRPRKVLR
jgi:hypothetical protein